MTTEYHSNFNSTKDEIILFYPSSMVSFNGRAYNILIVVDTGNTGIHHSNYCSLALPANRVVSSA